MFEVIGTGNVLRLKELIAQGADINALNEWGGAPLHIASFMGDRNSLKELIANGADVNVKDGDGRTPLYVATSWNRLGCVEELLAQGADVNARTNDGKTALDISDEKSCAEIIILLQEKSKYFEKQKIKE